MLIVGLVFVSKIFFMVLQFLQINFLSMLGVDILDRLQVASFEEAEAQGEDVLLVLVVLDLAVVLFDGLVHGIGNVEGLPGLFLHLLDLEGGDPAARFIGVHHFGDAILVEHGHLGGVDVPVMPAYGLVVGAGQYLLVHYVGELVVPETVHVLLLDAYLLFKIRKRILVEELDPEAGGAKLGLLACAVIK